MEPSTTLNAMTPRLTQATELDATRVLDVVRSIEHHLRVAGLRLAIEGEGMPADVVEALAGFARFLDEKLD